MIEYLILAAIYSSLIIGICFIFNNEIREIKIKIFLRNRLISKKRELKEKGSVQKAMENMIKLAVPKPISQKSFFLFILLVFTITFIIGIKNFSLSKAIFTSSFTGLMPILLLKIRVESLRRRSSFEGEKFMNAFLSQYRISHFNIFDAIEKVVQNSDDTRIINGLLIKLMMELRTTNDKEHIRKACEEFAYGLNTNWGRMLAYNISFAIERGVNISMSLEDIIIQLREARTLFEERKRMNSEAARIVVYLIPILYIGTLVLSMALMGLSLGDILVNQFYSEEGYSFFLISIFLMLANISLIETVNNQKFDY